MENEHFDDEEAIDRRLAGTDSEEKSEYFGLSEDWSKLIKGSDGKERSIAGLKIIGKSAFNVGKWTFTEALPKFAELQKKAIEEQIAKSKK